MTDLSTMSLKQLANTYNDVAKSLGRPTIKKFSDRKSATRRTEAIRKELGAGKVRPVGRPAAHAGKKIYPTVEVNPRRPDSHGYHSFKIVANNPGITYENFIKKGGLSNGLRWDLAHKFVKVV